MFQGFALKQKEPGTQERRGFEDFQVPKIGNETRTYGFV
jgi:hypothetical protein